MQEYILYNKNSLQIIWVASSFTGVINFYQEDTHNIIVLSKSTTDYSKYEKVILELNTDYISQFKRPVYGNLVMNLSKTKYSLSKATTKLDRAINWASSARRLVGKSRKHLEKQVGILNRQLKVAV